MVYMVYMVLKPYKPCYYIIGMLENVLEFIVI